MAPHDSSKRDSDALSRLRHYVDRTKIIDDRRERPGPASCKRLIIEAAAPVYEDEDDEGPITTRWAAG
jgi:hypothetical protein